MKKSTKIAIISGIVVVVVSVLAVTVHLRLSAIEGNEVNSNKSTIHKINEIVNSVGNQNATNSEANESPEQRANEGK